VSAPADKYVSDQQQRVLRLIRTLAGNELQGLAPGEITKLQGCDPAQTSRDLINLKHIGWAEQIAETGRWRLGPEIVQISLRYAAGLDRAQARVNELSNRFSRT
jgi:DNA-binding IclR family transcriptional regulator